MTDIHDYFHSVLEKREHGATRIIEFDIPTLNDAIDRHAERIGEKPA
jgi:hypothetical protein